MKVFHHEGQSQLLIIPVGFVMNSSSARVFSECFGFPIPPTLQLVFIYHSL